MRARTCPALILSFTIQAFTILAFTILAFAILAFAPWGTASVANAQSVHLPGEIGGAPALPPPPLTNPDLGSTLNNSTTRPDLSTTFKSLGPTPTPTTVDLPPAAGVPKAVAPPSAYKFACDVAPGESACKREALPDGGDSDGTCDCSKDPCYDKPDGMRVCEKQ
jgi:hypothetical protein